MCIRDRFLISPNGIVSELVRDNNQDLGANYYNWTFTSVAHWGENSFGEWSLKVSDTLFGGASDEKFNNWSLNFYGTPEPDYDGDGLPDYADSWLGTGVTNPDFDADTSLSFFDLHRRDRAIGQYHQLRLFAPMLLTTVQLNGKDGRP